MRFGKTGGRLALILIIVLGAGLFLSGCAASPKGRLDMDRMHSGDVIAAVKNGTLAIDRGITIGDAFDHYGGFHFKENEWSHFKTQNQRNIIELTAKMNLGVANLSDDIIGAIKKAEYVIQFAANVDKSIEIRYMGFVVTLGNGLVKEHDIPRSRHDDYLKPVFGNYKFSNARYELVIQGLL